MLKPEHIVTDNDGTKWIRKGRQKTDVMCNIPLLKQAENILKKYLYRLEDGYKTCLPVPTNQKMNAYLKEIFAICNIRKKITTHSARHTFATIVCLANGVSIENIAKMLGHTTTKQTADYAKVLDRSVKNAMQQVQQAITKNIIEPQVVI